MGSNTKIPWAHHTLNFWRGCTKVSPGCDNCYMYREQKRWGHDPSKVVRTSKAIWRQPLSKGIHRWKAGERVFVNSWSDFFHPDADQWRGEAWEVMLNRPDLIWMILTKRPELINPKHLPKLLDNRMPANFWLGVTVENQEKANKRIQLLLDSPAQVKFVSVEPMLGPVNLNKVTYILSEASVCIGSVLVARTGIFHSCGKSDGLDWVICGCESGPGRRETKIEWIRDLRDQCIEANVPFFLKQMDVGGKLVKMPEFKGRVWDQLPRINNA